MKFTLLRLTCKESSLLTSRRLDGPLLMRERIALRLHLAVCKACPAFDRQMQTLRQAMGQWRSYVERDDGSP